MGLAISWLAVKASAKEEVLSSLGFSETQEKEEIPASEISSAELPSGWYLIWFNKFESKFVQKDIVSKLSLANPVVLCVVEEHVMYSRSEYWERGRQIWKIVHDAQNNIFDLNITGTAPDYFESLKTEVFSKQHAEGGENADVDLVFELPLEPVQRLIFFKYDETTPELENLEYTVLENNNPENAPIPPKPWWRSWGK